MVHSGYSKIFLIFSLKDKKTRTKSMVEEIELERMSTIVMT
jgi:hypothetical protein